LLQDVPLFPISSTQIREMKAQGQDVSAFLPAQVAEVY
jgi:nicotinic acid mononucleotide adenylyltransferase